MNSRKEVTIMNLKDIGTQLMYTTAPIYASKPDGTTSFGTSFVFLINQSKDTSIPLLITNYHVVENATHGYFEMHISKNGSPTSEVAKVQFDSSIIPSSRLGDLDLVAFPLAGALNDLQSKGVSLFYRGIDLNLIPKEDAIVELSAIEDVTFIGYPSSIYDMNNKIPVIRQGITATPIWNDFQGKKEFLIDASVFPGSSGSPVFVYNRGTYPTKDGIVVGNRVLFIGVLKGTFSMKQDYLDLGLVINSSAFLEELDRYIIRATGKPIQ